jgi:hypothetical protein
MEPVIGHLLALEAMRRRVRTAETQTRPARSLDLPATSLPHVLAEPAANVSPGRLISSLLAGRAMEGRGSEEAR